MRPGIGSPTRRQHRLFRRRGPLPRRAAIARAHCKDPQALMTCAPGIGSAICCCYCCSWWHLEQKRQGSQSFRCPSEVLFWAPFTHFGASQNHRQNGGNPLIFPRFCSRMSDPISPNPTPKRATARGTVARFCGGGPRTVARGSFGGITERPGQDRQCSGSETMPLKDLEIRALKPADRVYKHGRARAVY